MSGLLAVCGLPAAAQQTKQPRAFQLADWYRLTTVSSPAISPAGDQVAFVVTTVRETDNKRHNEIWLAPTVCTGAACLPTRLTSPGSEATRPRWSPDGKLLLFSSSRPTESGKPSTKTWALRMDRPGGEAFETDSVPGGSMPRDRRFVVWSDSMAADSARDTTKAEDLFAKMGAMARPPFGAITRPIDPARFDGRHVVDMGYKSNERGFVPNRYERRVWKASQLWMKRFDGTPKKMLTKTAYTHDDVAVSPDGQWIAFTADSGLRSDSAVQAFRDSLARLPYDSARDERPRRTVDVYVVPVDGGTPRRVVRGAGEPGDIGELRWSPDSKTIAWIANPSRVKSLRIYTQAVSGGEPVNILGDWKYEPDSYEWLPNGEISMTASVGGRSALFLVSPKTKQVREVLGGRRRLSGFSWDAAGKRVAYVSSSITAPGELYVAGVNGAGERRLTFFNDALNKEVAWSDAERITFPSVGGVEIEGWLMKPYGYEPGKKYPLVLYIHGGPHSQYNEGWFDETQNLAATGMWVLYTNPRGSSGYGADFTYSTRGRWGAEDYQDLMKAVDLVAKRADVDSTRMGVTGGSYGGWMTAWITTKTDRFNAAQSDRMISEWSYWYGASDAQGLTEWEFYGKPWDNFAMYDSLSPIRRVNTVKTPTLIVQSEDDFRTPMGNAELWFLALKKRDVPVELVRYPRSTHELSRSGEPWLLVDRLGRLRQWFGYWLQADGIKSVTAGEGR